MSQNSKMVGLSFKKTLYSKASWRVPQSVMTGYAPTAFLGGNKDKEKFNGCTVCRTVYVDIDPPPFYRDDCIPSYLVIYSSTYTCLSLWGTHTTDLKWYTFYKEQRGYSPYSVCDFLLLLMFVCLQRCFNQIWLFRSVDRPLTKPSERRDSISNRGPPE